MGAHGSDGTQDAECLQLTALQLAVLRLAARGHSTAQIAGELGLEIEEARRHLRDAIRALGTRSKLEALIQAIRSGLVPPP